MSQPVLVTGFEPFAGRPENPSQLVARNLDGRTIAGRRVVSRVLPVVCDGLAERLENMIAQEQPDLILCTGLGPGRTAVALERVAVNMLDFESPDNSGELRQNEPIDRGGPDARLSPLPFADIVEAWRRVNVPGYISNSAGTYLCNQALYEALRIAEAMTPPATAGFIHFPCLPEQAIASGAHNTPSMALDCMERAVELAIEVTVPWIESRDAGRRVAAGV